MTDLSLLCVIRLLNQECGGVTHGIFSEVECERVEWLRFECKGSGDLPPPFLETARDPGGRGVASRGVISIGL